MYDSYDITVTKEGTSKVSKLNSKCNGMNKPAVTFDIARHGKGSLLFKLLANIYKNLSEMPPF